MYVEVLSEHGYKIKYSGTGEILYQFQCNKCNKTFEIRRSVRDQSKVNCTYCNSTRTEVVINARGIHFKGKGFPSQDFKLDAEIAKQDEIMREGFSCKSEIETAKHMMKERDERLVKQGLKVLPGAEYRGKEVVEEVLKVSPEQREQVEKQLHYAKNPHEKNMLKKQRQQMEQIDGTVQKKVKTKTLGKEVLAKAAKQQSKMITK